MKVNETIVTREDAAITLVLPNSQRIPVLTYHSIDDSGSVISTSAETFGRQMQFLHDRGFRTLTVAGLSENIRNREKIDERTVVLTFDDGFENFLTSAMPVLQEYSFTATVFAVTNLCGGFNDWAGNPGSFPRSKLMSWQQLKEISDYGIEIGSHTFSHRDLTKLIKHDADIEISQSRKMIEDAIGHEVRSFAYPYGRYNDVIVNSIRNTYTAACSTNLGKIRNGSDFARLERVDSYYLSDKVLSIFETPKIDKYLAARQFLRNIKGAVVKN
jgi:peptidoglycan/xylan/chitin deacetylase (PgdA/CDA1 family)